MNNSKRSILNAIIATASNLVNGLLGFIVMYFTIRTYGSDFNGVNATANQIVAILLLFEGGVTLATNVSLFKPYLSNDRKTINQILTATNRKFQKIGILFLLSGIAISFIYAIYLETNIVFEQVVFIFLMAVFPSFINIYAIIKYRIVIQAEGKEYVLHFISLITIFLSHITNIVTILAGGSFINIRINTMIFLFLQYYLVYMFYRRNLVKCNFKDVPDYTLIQGTGDVFVQKLLSAIYLAAPILLISLLDGGGAVLASIYAVYNNVFQLIRGVMQSIMDGPRLSLGQLINKADQVRIYDKFRKYEYITILMCAVFISITGVMIIPFVTWYTKDFNNSDYINLGVPFILCITLILEIIHIPSGNYLNMSGRFKVAKRIQIIALGVMCCSLLLFTFHLGLYGILLSVLLTALTLAIGEIGYVHIVVFNEVKSFIHIFIVNVLSILLIIYTLSKVWIIIEVYTFTIILVGAIITSIITVLIVTLVNILFCNNLFKDTVLLAIQTIKLFIKKRERL